MYGTSYLFPEKVGFEKGDPCWFAENYYCQGCGRCEHEYDLRTAEEVALDELAEQLSEYEFYLSCYDDPDVIADMVICIIAMKWKFEKMMLAYQAAH